MPSPPRPLVILHGYSDTSRSFEPLSQALSQATGRTPDVISLGDYVTLNDHVAFPDLLDALDKAWTLHNLPRTEASADMVVHSTGALVARQWLHWLTRVRTPHSPCPVKNLVMLAPANFGSPLAHKGQSFIGRIIKGSQPNADGPLQSGRNILKGLELASPFTFALAESDRFAPEPEQLYKPGRVLCTTLVGNRGYTGVMAMANEDGGDGTVRISTANMDCARLSFDFAAQPDGAPPVYQRSTGRAAFGLIDRFNHSTIALKDNPSSALTTEIVHRISAALTVTDDRFDAHANSMDRLTALASKPAIAFQNTVIRAFDDLPEPRPVRDYNVAFREEGTQENGGAMARYIHEIAVEHVHTFSDDPSHRAFYFNTPRLLDRVDRADESLGIAVAAYPRLQDTTARVGFKPLDQGGMDCARTAIPADMVDTIFKPHRTLLVTLKLPWHRGRLLNFRRPTDPYQQL